MRNFVGTVGGPIGSGVVYDQVCFGIVLMNLAAVCLTGGLVVLVSDHLKQLFILHVLKDAS